MTPTTGKRPERTMKANDATLDIGGTTLRAAHSNEEMIHILSGLSWMYSPLRGLEGGDLGRLARHIRNGNTTLPGRNPMQSEELVFEALHRSAELHKQWDQVERKLRWRKYGLTLALTAPMTALLIGFVIFQDRLFTLILNAKPEPATAGPKQAAAEELAASLWSIAGTYVIPIFLGVILLGAMSFAVARVFRPGPR